MLPLEAIGPIDGRYRKVAAPLADYFSEAALIRYRLIVEGEYLIFLSQTKGIDLRKFTAIEQKLVRNLYELSPAGAAKVKEFEATTNHDVKAVEYFIKEQLKSTTLANISEWTHFALTSEDTNNLSYGLMISEALQKVIIPGLASVLAAWEKLAKDYQKLPMLARTHGQSASPTTLGKEFKVFAARLARQLAALKQYKMLVKINGATGNYNAQLAAYPKINWPNFSRSFIKHLGQYQKVNLEPNLITAQIEPHDTYAELFDLMRRVNTILIDFNQDIWRYISDGWISQKPKAGEVGSSTMPHKVNPIDFENSEGNLGMANALFGYFSQKLPISRLQRDLSDSTVERNFGTALAYSLIAYTSILKGLGKISANKAKITADLLDHQEVLAEGIQTILRRAGAAMPYEQLKQLTRGKKVTAADFTRFIDQLEVSASLKKELKKLSVETYIGLADRL